MADAFPPPEQLAPHRKPMLMVDRVLAFDGETIRVASTVDPGNPFFQPGRGLPSYVGVEIMAQAAAMLQAMRQRAAGGGGAPGVGFLLGTRKYRAEVDWFAAGDVLEVEASGQVDDSEVQSVACRIRLPGGQEACSATLNVFRAKAPTASGE